MVAKRIIACLDVKEDKVVKGVQFQQHRIVGDILERALFYCDSGADEIVFYDITASCENRLVNHTWVQYVAKLLNIPFCVAGGIKSVQDAETILHAGADKISINSPALANPNFIDELVKQFGSQCVVVGIDSFKQENNYQVFQYTGELTKTKNTRRNTMDWILEVQARGAGEIVLNCMNQDGRQNGYDLKQLSELRKACKIPLIASGGAGCYQHFLDVFQKTNVDGALAASVFHSNTMTISALKAYLTQHQIEVRPYD